MMLDVILDRVRAGDQKRKLLPGVDVNDSQFSQRSLQLAACAVGCNGLSSRRPLAIEEDQMAVFSVWQSFFPAGVREEGLAITKAIWRDMTSFDGYVSHELIEDLDDPGHLVVVSKWSSRGRADQVLREYADAPNARRANELVSRPRTRFVGRPVDRD
jgi:heme-degrading monooxygenase HmoA